MSKLSERLAKKIKEDLNIDVDSNTLRRTYAGRGMKSQGSFVWEIKCINGPYYLGSGDSASVCIRNDIHLSIIDNSEIVADKVRED